MPSARLRHSLGSPRLQHRGSRIQYSWRSAFGLHPEREPVWETVSPDARARGDLLLERDDDRALSTVGGEEHPLGLDAAQLRRLEVGDDDDRLPDELFGGVDGRDPRDDLASLAA